MQDKKKKIAAISAAVMSYVQMEQVACASQMQAAHEQKPTPVFPVASPWSLSGRQAIMDRRYQMQMKVFR